ncbi:hypothetical protein M153_2800006626 [Pseudoloma neurophilia]|uniref:Uncharacterized protein n=1 Tax=Pseudoloma neurophilia TaxID=146866 RepID=A0A0R0M5N9_9MICR|nr:hypothetical protein M153_2800006626 [Pseudoloma neurophilia]
MLEDLLLIVNLENDLIYRFSSAKTKEKEQELLLLAYASLDIFEEIRQSLAEYFYFSVDRFLNMKVSVLLLPSGYKIIFVNEWNDPDKIMAFLVEIHKIFRKVLLDFSQNDNCTKIDQEIREKHSEHVKLGHK